MRLLIPEMCVEVVLFSFSYVHHHFATVRHRDRETGQDLSAISVWVLVWVHASLRVRVRGTSG